MRLGFSLIELSIVLVIIGLIAGGILVGRDLINAATVRSQITQIEKYRTATNIFLEKYGQLPGDLSAARAPQFGFSLGTGCDGSQGKRNGNGSIEGYMTSVSYPEVQYGETGLFWQDLSAARLIESLPGTVPCAYGSPVDASATEMILPAGKLRNTTVYLFYANNYNWFGLSTVAGLDNNGTILGPGANIPVQQANSIDTKIDDDVPTAGSVQTLYVNYTVNFNNAVTAPNTAIVGGTATSCYDTTTNTYSTSSNNGEGANCALSFRLRK